MSVVWRVDDARVKWTLCPSCSRWHQEGQCAGVFSDAVKQGASADADKAEAHLAAEFEKIRAARGRFRWDGDRWTYTEPQETVDAVGE